MKALLVLLAAAACLTGCTSTGTSTGLRLPSLSLDCGGATAESRETVVTAPAYGVAPVANTYTTTERVVRTVEK